jgi:hypothetical protein
MSRLWSTLHIIAFAVKILPRTLCDISELCFYAEVEGQGCKQGRFGCQVGTIKCFLSQEICTF